MRELKASVTPKHLNVPAEATTSLLLLQPPAHWCIPTISLGRHEDAPVGRGSCRSVQPSAESDMSCSYREESSMLSSNLIQDKIQNKKSPVSSSRNQTEVSQEWTKECAGREQCGRAREAMVTPIHWRLFTRKPGGLTLRISEGIWMGKIMTTKAKQIPSPEMLHEN